MLVELELDTCWDQHPCLSAGLAVVDSWFVGAITCCKFNNQTPNLCLNQFYLHNTQAFHTHRKTFINPPKIVVQPRSIALIDHNRRGYQRGTRPDQRASKYARERTTRGIYMSHGHIFIFILSSFFYLSSEISYDFLVKPVSFLTSPQRLS